MPETLGRLAIDPLSRIVVGTCGNAPRETGRKVPSPVCGKCKLARRNSEVGESFVAEVKLLRGDSRWVWQAALPRRASRIAAWVASNDLSPFSCRTVLSLANLDHETGGDHDHGTREG